MGRVELLVYLLPVLRGRRDVPGEALLAAEVSRVPARAFGQVSSGRRETGCPPTCVLSLQGQYALFCSLSKRKAAVARGVGGLTREKHAAVGQVTGPLNMSPTQPGLSDGNQPLGPILGSVGHLKKTGLWAGEGYLHSSSPLFCKPPLSVAALTNLTLICRWFLH